MTEDYTPIKKMMTERMVGIYCSDVHGCKEICPECSEVLKMSLTHLDGCRHKEKGWPCNTCPDCCFTGEDKVKMVSVLDHMAKWMSEHPEEAASAVPNHHP